MHITVSALTFPPPEPILGREGWFGRNVGAPGKDPPARAGLFLAIGEPQVAGLQALFARHGASAALSAKATIKPTSSSGPWMRSIACRSSAADTNATDDGQPAPARR